MWSLGHWIVSDDNWAWLSFIVLVLYVLFKPDRRR